MDRMPPLSYITMTMVPTPTAPTQGGMSKQDVQSLPGTLELRDQVQRRSAPPPASRRSGRSATTAEFGSRAPCRRPTGAQWRNHEHQQPEVSGGEADRIPQGVGSIVATYRRHPETMRPKVFTGDGGGGWHVIRPGGRPPGSRRWCADLPAAVDSDGDGDDRREEHRDGVENARSVHEPRS